MILEAKSTVMCPKDQKEVSVRRECADCPDFKHLSLTGYGINVACKHGERREEELT